MGAGTPPKRGGEEGGDGNCSSLSLMSGSCCAPASLYEKVDMGRDRPSSRDSLPSHCVDAWLMDGPMTDAMDMGRSNGTTLSGEPGYGWMSTGSVIMPLSTMMTRGRAGTSGGGEAVRPLPTEAGVSDRRLRRLGVAAPSMDSSSLPSKSPSSAKRLWAGCCGVPAALLLAKLAGLLWKVGSSLGWRARRAARAPRLTRRRIFCGGCVAAVGVFSSEAKLL